ncbi:DUF4403 family protein [Flavihumibacter sp.]|uniref:DUF4403 family protein n=1 Tax=Flavihumibacter sp. TaxID=1913981 RepID=UPI002FC6F656|nr:DUF4403 family protein [Flavihumibacter sediminis]
MNYLKAIGCYLISGFVFSLVPGCTSTKKSTVNPNPIPTSRSLPPLMESVLNIPVKVVITPFLKQAESIAPKEIRSDGWPEYMLSSCDFRYKYRFVRSTFQFSCINNRISVAMNGNYQIAGSKTVCVMGQSVSPWINGSCGFGNEPMRKVNINLISDLRFTPDYRLQSTTRTEKVVPIDKCLVTIFNNDVTTEVMDSIAASVNLFGTNIDKVVKEMNFSNYLAPIGEKAGKKIPLGTYGFMKLNASSVRMGPINFSADTLRFTAGISCFPEISSDSINHSVTKHLPPLTNNTTGDGFALSSNAIYDYKTIDSLLTRTLKDRSFDVKGEKIRIEKVQVKGLEGYMVEFKITFTGTKRGTLFLKGTPDLDVNTQQLSVPDLEYDLNSSSIVLVIGKTFFNRQILENLRKQAKINVRELYLKNKQKIDDQFNRDITTGIRLKGNTSELKLNGLIINRDNVQVQAIVTGNVNLLISNLPGR